MEHTIEICVTSVESAVIAEQAGAHRIELCDNLWEGGTTPSAGMINRVRGQVDIDVFILIRPRGGDFFYSDDEFEIMKADIEFARKSGADGIVSGVLNKDGSVDEARTRELVELAAPLPFTFHRAFDLVPDPMEALNVIIDCGATRVLTSGQMQSAIEGVDLLQNLQTQFGVRIILMPGGGVSSNNIQELARATGCSEWHMTAKTWKDSAAELPTQDLLLNGASDIPEDKLMVASKSEIVKVISLLNEV